MNYGGVDYVLKIKSEKVSLLDMSQIDNLYQLGYYQAKKYIKNMAL